MVTQSIGGVALRQEKQTKISFKAIIVLLLFLMVGLWRVDTQLNDLAQWNNFTRILNIKSDQGTEETYVYFLGERMPIGKIEPIKTEVSKTEIMIGFSSGYHITVPYQAWYGDMSKAADRFVSEAKRYYAEFFP